MSIAINAGKFTRGDVFFVDPNELTVAFDDNVRRFPVSDDRIRELAHDIAGSPHGQIQPVTVRRIQDNRLKLVAGYNRYRAIQWANDNILEGKPPLKIKCVVQTLNDSEAWMLALHENTGQNKMSPVDEAYACRTLMEKYGKTADDVAKEFGQTSAAWVTHRRLPLLSLPDDVQRRVHDESLEDHINLSAALTIAEVTGGGADEVHGFIAAVEELPETPTGPMIGLDSEEGAELAHVSEVGLLERQQIDELLAISNLIGPAPELPPAPPKKKGKVTRAKVLKVAREKKLPGANKSRSMRDVRELFGRIAGGPGENKYLRKIAAAFGPYADGGDEDEFEKVLNRNVRKDGE